jgi:hypothetical protein
MKNRGLIISMSLWVLWMRRRWILRPTMRCRYFEVLVVRWKSIGLGEVRGLAERWCSYGNCPQNGATQTGEVTAG